MPEQEPIGGSERTCVSVSRVLACLPLEYQQQISFFNWQAFSLPTDTIPIALTCLQAPDICLIWHALSEVHMQACQKLL